VPDTPYRNLADLIGCQVAEHHARRLLDGDGSDGDWSYRRFGDEAFRIAQACRTLGVRPGAAVALLPSSDLRSILTIFAVWMIGARVTVVDEASDLHRVRSLASSRVLLGPAAQAAPMRKAVAQVKGARAVTFDVPAPQCDDFAQRISMSDSRFNPDTEVTLAAPAWLDTGPPEAVLDQGQIIARAVELARVTALTEGKLLLDAASDARCSLSGVVAWTAALLGGARIRRLSTPAGGRVWEECAEHSARVVLLDARSAAGLPPSPAALPRPRVLFARGRGADTGAIASRLGADTLRA
jgi:hypothetical protein